MPTPKSRSKSNSNIELAYVAALGNGAKARYVLSNKRKLLIEVEDASELKDYSIDLLAMSPSSKRLREKTQSINKLDRNLILSLAMVGLAVIAAMLLDLPWTVLLLALVAVGAIAVIYLVRKKTRSEQQRRKYIFVSRVAQVPLVEIEFLKPSNKLDRFVVLLQERIQAALAASELDEKELLAGELRALRRLTENGFLEKTHYEKAKRLLLAKSG